MKFWRFDLLGRKFNNLIRNPVHFCGLLGEKMGKKIIKGKRHQGTGRTSYFGHREKVARSVKEKAGNSAVCKEFSTAILKEFSDLTWYIFPPLHPSVHLKGQLGKKYYDPQATYQLHKTRSWLPIACSMNKTRHLEAAFLQC